MNTFCNRTLLVPASVLTFDHDSISCIEILLRRNPLRCVLRGTCSTISDSDPVYNRFGLLGPNDEYKRENNDSKTIIKQQLHINKF